jgi:hypothetical protein
MLSDQSQLPEEQRTEYLHQTLHKKFLTGAPLEATCARYVESLRRQLRKLDFKSKGTIEMPDLRALIYDHASIALIEALYGSEILRMFPNIADTFEKADSNLLALISGKPKFMNPSAYKPRDDLLSMLREWSEAAKLNENTGDEDAEWTEWGSRVVRVKAQAMRDSEHSGPFLSSVDHKLTCTFSGDYGC